MTEPRGDGPLYGLLAEYKTPGALIRAATRIRDAGYTKWDCYSPFPVHGIDKAMGVKRTILPWLIFMGGMTGCIGALTLQWWANAFDWPWIISGKPFFSIPASIPITFEGTILISGFTAFLGMWGLNKLPRVWHPFFRNDRFVKVTDNAFFIGVEAEDPKFTRDGTAALLQDGSVAVETCNLDPDPAKNRLPSGIKSFIGITTVLALIPILLVAHARASTSSEPRIHIITDMDWQPKDKSESTTNLFPDHRGMRAPIEGTVAFGDLRSDDHFYRGTIPGETPRWADTFPIADPERHVQGITLDERTMARGQERFGIYCSPCHGLSGRGNGMIHQRATKVANRWTPPVDLQSERIVRLPHGQLFFTIGNGVRNMPGYASQLAPEDRWAIVLYLRALQRSQNARVDDVPSDQRDSIR